MAQKAKKRRKKKRPDGPAAKEMAYFIRRASHVDNTTWFNDEGRRIAFARVTHASWFMRMFDSDQKPQIVRGSLQEGDVAFVEVLPHWLPEDTTPEQYLAAIEQTMADVASGREPSRQAVRTFLERQRIKHSN